MTEKRIKIIHIIYGVALSMLIVALGVCFALSCLDIYKSAETSPFTPEAIKSHFVALIIPTVLCVLAIIGGACLHIFLPAEDKKLRSNIEDKHIIKNLSKRINFKEAPKQLVDIVKSQRRFRVAFLVITIFNAVINAVTAIFYIFVGSELRTTSPENLVEFLPQCATALSYAIIPIFVIAVYIIFANFTYSRELEAIKLIIENNKKMGNPVSKIEAKEEKTCFFEKHKKKILIITRCVILVVAIGLIITSFFFDDLKEVASLAGDKVCSGCIGLF